MQIRYNIDNNEEAVREIQRYLLTVTNADENPGITVTGTFDAITEQALRNFQKNNNLNETGIADLETWDLLWETHRLTPLEETESFLPDITVFNMEIGDVGYQIIILQAILGEFSDIYPNTPRPAVTGQFGLTTADAVRAIQRNYGLYADGVVTPALWNRMLRDHQAQRKQEQYSHIFDA